MNKAITAAVIIIGDEILSGQTNDRNLNFLAKRLNELFIPLKTARFIGDNEELIVKTVQELCATHTYVFTSGGIGPTHDDITAQSIAKAFGKNLTLSMEAKKRLIDHYGDEKLLNEARLRMATVPEGATLIDNSVTAAPGFKLENVYVFAGVPQIMQAMFESVAPTLEQGKPTFRKTLDCNVGEGHIAQELRTIQENFPGITIGSYPHYVKDEEGSYYSLSLVFTGEDPNQVDQVLALAKEVVERRQQDPDHKAFLKNFLRAK